MAQSCAKCGVALVEESRFCHICGNPVDEKIQTSRLERSTLQSSELVITGSPYFPSRLVIKHEGATIASVHTKTIADEGFVIGRADNKSKPDLDLALYSTPDQAMYISRRHAIIRRSNEDGLTITDLGSSNGTFKNGVQLGRNVAHVLYDTDTLCFGKMVLEVYSSP